MVVTILNNASLIPLDVILVRYFFRIFSTLNCTFWRSVCNTKYVIFISNPKLIFIILAYALLFYNYVCCVFVMI